MFDGLQRVWETFFNLDLIGQTLPALLRVGLLNTLLLAVLASVIGVGVVVVIAAGLMSSKVAVRLPCRAYVDVLRGLPHILTVYLVGQGLPLAGITLFGESTYGYAALAIGLLEGAYMAEIFRAGFQSVERGQIEASRSLGLSHLETLRFVVFPTGARRVLPPLTGQFILVIKGTALVYLLGLTADQREMFAIAQDTAIVNASLSPLVAAGLLFLAITVPMTYAVNAWERRLRDGRKDAPTDTATDMDRALAHQGTG
ncbi:amino acid ABC transporter permease [Planotetraspora phitsanulokensis]|uniref:Amino acid ABC transporter permease n=1 Tax=Planotetraspora phitsanulokensis TaxID=575192 RepID=A0A8J3XHI9_9ACTN|nr:amino acid ABC transporter permease [Planotetraspora phitsanulokensis]GII41180.1 amino acid ABC transporter permease [Planotetraspora phitsanulokensis]